MSVGTTLGRILGQFLVGLGALFLIIDVVVTLQPEKDMIRSELITRGFWFVISRPVYYSLLVVGVVLAIIAYTIERRGRGARLIRSLRELRNAGVITEEEFKEREKKLLEK